MLIIAKINTKILQNWLKILGTVIRLKSYKDTVNNLIVDKDTKVICQGISGKHGTIQTKIGVEFGTRFVGGVSKKIKIQKHLDLPVFHSVREAVKVTNPDASIIYVPAPLAKNALLEAIQEEIKLIICVTKGIPYHDMIKVYDVLQKQNKSRLLGPHSSGIIVPDACKIGVIPHIICRKGNVAVISRSGTYSYEIISQITRNNLGQSCCINIGGDAVIGTDYVDCLEIFLKDSNTKAIVLIGEIGSDFEEDAAKYLKQNNTGQNKKIVIATVVGLTAQPNKRYGHASAIVTSRDGGAKLKIEMLQTAGVVIARNPSQVGKTVYDELQKQK